MVADISMERLAKYSAESSFPAFDALSADVVAPSHTSFMRIAAMSASHVGTAATIAL